MRMTAKQLDSLLQIEQRTIQTGSASLSRRQAELWCHSHVNDNWHELPIMLMARGYNEDYVNFTEVDPLSVYELDDSGCFIELPGWWLRFQLWLRDSAVCKCHHRWSDHDASCATACMWSNQICYCRKFRL